MITLASVINKFKASFLTQYSVSSNQILALNALNICRTSASPVMQMTCTDCAHQVFVPHSCGHRLCPHCQHHDQSAGKPICTAFAARRVKV